MKCPSVSKRFFSAILMAGLLLSTAAKTNAEALQQQRISYNPTNDLMTVQVEQISLKAVLSRIALLSGIEISMDPRVEHEVSAEINSQPLEEGIKQLVRDLNSVFLYSEPGETNFAPGSFR